MVRRNPFVILSRLRAIDEKMRRAELAVARSAHDQARARLEAYRAKHRETIPVEDLISAVELRSLQLRGVVSHEALMRAADEFDRSAKHLSTKAEGWRRAAADLDAAEKLEARKRDEAARRARTAAERSLDDLLGMLHGRKESTA
jgi:flagellar export protein FliJ